MLIFGADEALTPEHPPMETTLEMYSDQDLPARLLHLLHHTASSASGSLQDASRVHDDRARLMHTLGQQPPEQLAATIGQLLILQSAAALPWTASFLALEADEPKVMPLISSPFIICFTLANLRSRCHDTSGNRTLTTDAWSLDDEFSSCFQ